VRRAHVRRPLSTVVAVVERPCRRGFRRTPPTRAECSLSHRAASNACVGRRRARDDEQRRVGHGDPLCVAECRAVAGRCAQVAVADAVDLRLAEVHDPDLDKRQRRQTVMAGFAAPLGVACRCARRLGRRRARRVIGTPCSRFPWARGSPVRSAGARLEVARPPPRRTPPCRSDELIEDTSIVLDRTRCGAWPVREDPGRNRGLRSWQRLARLKLGESVRRDARALAADGWQVTRRSRCARSAALAISSAPS
jgi:hypothetical protein